MSRRTPFLLIVEPDNSVDLPYRYFSEWYAPVAMRRVTSIDVARSILDEKLPTMVLLSTSYSAHKTLRFLETLKLKMNMEVVPLVYVVNWSVRIQHILGTSWGDKVGILNTLSSQEEVRVVTRNLLQG